MLSIRHLQSELGTRERLPQLERWNADVLALSAPKAGQYLDGAVELAAFANDRHPVVDARLQRAIADGVQAPRPAQVRTAAYASADTAQPSRRDSGQPVVTFAAARGDDEVGRASCRERVCQYVSISVVGVSIKKKPV